MRRVRLVLVGAALGLLATAVPARSLAITAPEPAQRAATPPVVSVSGRHLVDGSGNPVRLLGVNRSGTEYVCTGDYSHGYLFDGPDSAKSIRAMRSWGIDAVRLPLNEDCWLGINGIQPGLTAATYQAKIHQYVQRLQDQGLDVVLDLHVAAPGDRLAKGIIPMPDADHAPAFWSSVATSFLGNRGVLFDLYNEPHDVGWRCWRDGCAMPAGGKGSERHPAYQSAGMQQLVDAIRSTGNGQPVMAGGLDYARNLDGWLRYRPVDPAGQLVASEHNYGGGLAPCYRRCRSALRSTARTTPVVVGEMGEVDCRHAYVDRFMRFADRVGLSYLGWAWDAHGGWTCTGGPSLITDYRGTPTAFGVGIRDHLRALRAGAVGSGTGGSS